MNTPTPPYSALIRREPESWRGGARLGIPPEESGYETGRNEEFTRKRKGYGAHHKTSQELLRAALRFARVPQQRKGYGAHDKEGRNNFAPRSVLREVLKGPKGAARTTKKARNCLALRSVLRESLWRPLLTAKLRCRPQA